MPLSRRWAHIGSKAEKMAAGSDFLKAPTWTLYSIPSGLGRPSDTAKTSAAACSALSAGFAARARMARSNASRSMGRNRIPLPVRAPTPTTSAAGSVTSYCRSTRSRTRSAFDTASKLTATSVSSSDPAFRPAVSLSATTSIVASRTSSPFNRRSMASRSTPWMALRTSRAAKNTSFSRALTFRRADAAISRAA